jgi:hypothetical protein
VTSTVARTGPGESVEPRAAPVLVGGGVICGPDDAELGLDAGVAVGVGDGVGGDGVDDGEGVGVVDGIGFGVAAAAST